MSDRVVVCCIRVVDDDAIVEDGERVVVEVKIVVVVGFRQSCGLLHQLLMMVL